jgi:hypothetical protein
MGVMRRVCCGVVAQVMPETRHPLSLLASYHANDFGGAECVEAVDEGNADLDFGGLAVGVSCGDAFTEGLEAAPLCLDPTSGVISRPALPERPAIVASGS